MIPIERRGQRINLKLEQLPGNTQYSIRQLTHSPGQLEERTVGFGAVDRFGPEKYVYVGDITQVFAMASNRPEISKIQGFDVHPQVLIFQEVWKKPTRLFENGAPYKRELEQNWKTMQEIFKDGTLFNDGPVVNPRHRQGEDFQLADRWGVWVPYPLVEEVWKLSEATTSTNGN